uniref:Uncharacterized protein n=1 Tax=Strongyloides venezuelensis TaxID=75913 RepID=A0A0K0G5Q3_STRVS
MGSERKNNKAFIFFVSSIMSTISNKRSRRVMYAFMSKFLSSYGLNKVQTSDILLDFTCCVIGRLLIRDRLFDSILSCIRFI